MRIRKANQWGILALSLVLPLVILVVIISKYWKFVDIIVHSNNWWLVVPMIGIVFLFQLGNGLFNKIYFKTVGIGLTFFEWLGLAIITSAGNYTLPRGGNVASAVYLKKKHNFPYTQFVSYIWCTSILIFWTSASLGLVLFGSYYLAEKSIALVPLVAMTGLFLGITTFMVLPRVMLEKISRLNRKLKEIIEDWLKFKTKILEIVQIVAVAFGILLLYGLLIKWEFLIIGVQISFLKALILSTAISISLLVNITPAGLGIKEGFFVGCGQLLMIPLPQLVLITLIDRILNTIIVLALSGYFPYLLFSKPKKIL